MDHLPWTDKAPRTEHTIFSSTITMTPEFKAFLSKEFDLSNRETEVVEQIGTAKSNKKIADTLFVTEKTVKFHLTNIYKKMRVKNRMELFNNLVAMATYAKENGSPAIPHEPAPGEMPVCTGCDYKNKAQDELPRGI